MKKYSKTLKIVKRLKLKKLISPPPPPPPPLHKNQRIRGAPAELAGAPKKNIFKRTEY